MLRATSHVVCDVVRRATVWHWPAKVWTTREAGSLDVGEWFSASPA